MFKIKKFYLKNVPLDIKSEDNKEEARGTPQAPGIKRNGLRFGTINEFPTSPTWIVKPPSRGLPITIP